VRVGVLDRPFAHPHCYVPARRVCALMDTLASSEIRALPSTARSRAIHTLLVEHMGDQRATFAGSFDLPLLALAESHDLQEELLGGPLAVDDDTTG
jgi:hypothetical protein